MFKKSKVKRKTPFLVFASIITLLMIMPVIFSSSLFFDDAPKWSFILSNLLTTYITNTTILVISVGFLSISIGLYAAYIVETKTFIGKKILSNILYLPLAIPAYVLCYIYVDTLSYSGRISQFISFLNMDFNQFVFSMPMAIFILTLALFPYAYLSFRVYFKTRNTHHFDVAKSLRIPLLKRITHIHLPLIFPTLISALLFITFETVNDYGVTKYLNIKTLTVGMFDSWFQMNDFTSSLYLAFIYIGTLILFSGIYLLILKKPIGNTTKSQSKVFSKKLSIKQTIIYTTPLWIVMILSLIIPLIELTLNTFQSFDSQDLLPLFNSFIQTIFITITVSCIIILISIIISNAQRLSHKKHRTSFLKLPTIGYAFPSVMVALIYYYFFVRIDRFLDPAYQTIFQSGHILSLSIFVLIGALVFKYFAVGYKQISNVYDIIGVQHTLTSYTLKKSKWKTLLSVDIPMIKRGLIAGFILSFIDIIKELPITLLLRPFNVQSLSTLIFTYINNEDISKASTASLLLVMITGILIIILQSFGKGKNVS